MEYIYYFYADVVNKPITSADEVVSFNLADVGKGSTVGEGRS